MITRCFFFVLPFLLASSVVAALPVPLLDIGLPLDPIADEDEAGSLADGKPLYSTNRLPRPRPPSIRVIFSICGSFPTFHHFPMPQFLFSFSLSPLQSIPAPLLVPASASCSENCPSGPRPLKRKARGSLTRMRKWPGAASWRTTLRTRAATRPRRRCRRIVEAMGAAVMTPHPGAAPGTPLPRCRRGRTWTATRSCSKTTQAPRRLSSSVRHFARRRCRGCKERRRASRSGARSRTRRTSPHARGSSSRSESGSTPGAQRRSPKGART